MIFYQDEAFTIYQGDSRLVLPSLPAQSVNCVVTSPPYYGLRDYDESAQIGLEKTPGEYVSELVKVFREVRRVLRDDGTVWLNLGDSYANDGKWGGSTGGRHVLALHGDTSIGRGRKFTGLKPKDLIGIPWRVAFALQADGWWLRQDIIWAKSNPMPESVKDRCTKSHEHIFLLTKAPRYYFDETAMREPAVYGDDDRKGRAKDEHKSHPTASVNGIRPRSATATTPPPGKMPQRRAERAEVEIYDGTRNKRDVWIVPTAPYAEAHFATFPPDLIRPCVRAGCPPGGVVLDPFAGSGTTLQVAEQEGRRGVGIELNVGYCALALERLAERKLFFEEVDNCLQTAKH